MEMKIFICVTCGTKMIPASGIHYDQLMKSLYPEGQRCDICAPMSDRWFLDYNEYMQQESIKAWK